MKLRYLAAMLLGLAACSKSAPPPKPAPAPIHRASIEDCNRVYGHVITIVLISNLEPEQLYSKDELEKEANLLDQLYRQSGRKQLFFGYCQSQLNVEQTSCMLKAPSLEAMDACDIAHKTKKNP